MFLKSAAGKPVLERLTYWEQTVEHGPGYLCRIETAGLPPVEGVAESRTSAATIARHLQLTLARMYVQEWGQA